MGDMNAQTADISKITYAILHINTYLTGDTKRVLPHLLLITKIILKRKIYLSKHCKNLLQATQHLFTNKSVTSKKILKTSEWHAMLLFAVISKFYKEETPSRSYLFENTGVLIKVWYLYVKHSGVVGKICPVHKNWYNLKSKIKQMQ